MTTIPTTTQDGPLDQAIRELICKVYKVYYTGKLKVIELKPEGYTVIIGLDCEEKPIFINAELPWDKFLKFMELELRNRHLLTTDYFTGYRIVPEGPSCRNNYNNEQIYERRTY